MCFVLFLGNIFGVRVFKATADRQRRWGSELHHICTLHKRMRSSPIRRTRSAKPRAERRGNNVQELHDGLYTTPPLAVQAFVVEHHEGPQAFYRQTFSS